MKHPLLRCVALSCLLTAASAGLNAQTVSWQPTTGSTGEILHFALAQNGQLYGAGVDGIFTSTDDGRTWTKIHTGFARSVAIHPRGYIFATQGDNIIRSTDQGKNWQTVKRGSWMGLIYTSKRGTMIATAPNGILRSRGSGANWGWVFVHGRGSGCAVYSLAVTPDGKIFATKCTGEISYSLTDGYSWHQIKAGEITGGGFWTVYTNPAGEVFAGSTTSNSFTILRSADGGTTWTTILSRSVENACTFPFLMTQALVGDGKGQLAVTVMNAGVYISSDNGGNWALSNGGLPHPSFHCTPDTNQYNPEALTITPQGYLLVGTSESGIYRSTQPFSIPGAPPAMSIASDLAPPAFSLRQNYPNPFNPTTTIGFDLAKEALVTVKIFNALGQEVVTLLENHYVPSGTEEIPFDASGLPSGVYYYRIIASDVDGQGIVYTGAKKMMLLK
jgi:hypothetical protein